MEQINNKINKIHQCLSISVVALATFSSKPAVSGHGKHIIIIIGKLSNNNITIVKQSKTLAAAQSTQYTDPMLVHCWASIADCYSCSV